MIFVNVWKSNIYYLHEIEKKSKILRGLKWIQDSYNTKVHFLGGRGVSNGRTFGELNQCNEASTVVLSSLHQYQQQFQIPGNKGMLWCVVEYLRKDILEKVTWRSIWASSQRTGVQSRNSLNTNPDTDFWVDSTLITVETNAYHIPVLQRVCPYPTCSSLSPPKGLQ